MKFFIVSEKIKQQLNAYFSYGILKCQAILKISFFLGGGGVGGRNGGKICEMLLTFSSNAKRSFLTSGPGAERLDM